MKNNKNNESLEIKLKLPSSLPRFELSVNLGVSVMPMAVVINLSVHSSDFQCSCWVGTGSMLKCSNSFRTEFYVPNRKKGGGESKLIFTYICHKF